jgi:hypothetical protein
MTQMMKSPAAIKTISIAVFIITQKSVPGFHRGTPHSLTINLTKTEEQNILIAVTIPLYEKRSRHR